MRQSPLSVTATERLLDRLRGLDAKALAGAPSARRPQTLRASPRAHAGAGAITLERPPRADFGDYSTNAALLLAPGLGARP